MEIEKPKTVKDRKLLDHCQEKPCLICGTTHTTVGHHIKTKASGGPDEPWNLVPLCHAHHFQIHSQGTVRFAMFNPKFLAYLKYWKWREVLNTKGRISKYLPPTTLPEDK